MFGILALVLVISPPHFQAGNGWHVGAHGAWGWASTVPNRDCPACVPPHHTLAHVRADGILIQLGNYRAEHPPQASPGTWPPRIRRKDLIAGGGEGVPRHISFGEWFIRRRGIEHYLWVWFGRIHPTRRQLARANAELRTAR
ncbi:MAG TPA: hypothetical protein VFU33_12260 [Gaiellaceae bacterium]|nr:hypothetical protein [Gaiellaceae bacterium]